MPFWPERVENAIDASLQNRLLSIHGLPLDSLRCRHHHGDHHHRRVVWRLHALEARSCGKPPKASPETDGAFGVSGTSVCGVYSQYSVQME
ncbi:hypothetical protein Bxe_B0251 [Paraburkholderia xenovorans LB400]|uniref:Uncharacterized protein n=1 Tax=Paraburkholderia xenovorans (strain LB400) TaxID=266265 RepID=Q13JP5_PARXL|nr:hypothetical protein Bxe_B0251 [Paraburkholderia xenovorans LB400]